jgi:6-pyruvoyl-tetrahydropterin synthase
MNDIYGIACHFNISNAVSAPISFSNTSSWIGDATNSFLFQKNLSSNNLAMTMVRNNQTNINGFGQIGILSIPIDANAPANSDMILNFTDIKLIMNDGTEITDFNVINDTLKIVAPNSIGNIALNNGIEVYPNPMNDQLTIKMNQSENEAITISIQDLMGRVILHQEYQILDLNHEFKLNTSTLSSGNYILKINTSTNQYVQKLSK